MNPKTRLLAMLIAASALSFLPATAGEVDAPDALLVTAGVGLPAPSVGAKLRLFRLFEVGARIGGLPTLWTTDVDANFLVPNPDPGKKATWYGGLEYLYYHEDGAGGRFRIGNLDVIAGREQRFTPRLRWALEAGIAFMLFYEFHGGGAPILFPVTPVTRAELRYALF